MRTNINACYAPPQQRSHALTDAVQITSGTVQSIFCVGSLMSHVLQCKQFCALITSPIFPSAPSTYSYTLAGQYLIKALNEKHGESRKHALLQPPGAAGQTRASPALRPIEHGQVHRRRLLPLAQFQVRGLISLVCGARASEVCEQVKRKHAVGFRVVDFCALMLGLKKCYTCTLNEQKCDVPSCTRGRARGAIEET